MNIFVLSEDPLEAAQLQCDVHVRKMLIETAQLLSTAHRLLDGRPIKYQKLLKGGYVTRTTYLLPGESFEGDEKHMVGDEFTVYKATHVNHPCAIWTRESIGNYAWLLVHFQALCAEYSHRASGKVHETELKLGRVLTKFPNAIQIDGMTPHPICMNAHPECVVAGDPVQSYRNLYKVKSGSFKMSWTNREIPSWFKQ